MTALQAVQYVCFVLSVLRSCTAIAEIGAQVSVQRHDSRLAAIEDRSKSSQAHKQRASEHYWPQPRGAPGRYSRTSYGLPQTLLEHGNLTDALAWSWEAPEGLDNIVWGTLIDRDKNIYIISQQGVFKYTIDGELLWKRDDLTYFAMGSLSGNMLHTMQEGSGLMTALDLDTGSTIWERRVAEMTGFNGDMVTSNNGVVIAGVDQNETRGSSGAWSKRVVGVNGSTGEELWSYTPDCGMWNIMALFPDEDTFNFMDSCGGLYRVGLYNGTQLWKHAPDPDAWTDGGATLGPDNSIYTCSNEPYSLTKMNMYGMEVLKGRVRKFKQATGELVWEKETAEACVNFPAVTRDGKTLVLSDGAIVISPPSRIYSYGMNNATFEEFHETQMELLERKIQNSWWGQDDVNATILGYDTETGDLKWQHPVEAWGGMAFAGDEERGYNYAKGNAELPHCGPPHWGGPTFDDAGNIYMGRSTGDLYVYNPESGSEVTFPTNDGMMMSGVAFAPGLMVVPSCSFVYVFKY